MVDRESILSVRENGASGFEPNELRFRKLAARFIMHSVLATVGGVLVGFVLLHFVPLPPIGPHWRLKTLFADFPYSPAFWGSAMLLGFIVNRRIADRSACWVGPFGVLVLALLVGLSIPGYEASGYELNRTGHSFLNYIHGELFGLDPKACGSDECLGKVMFTTPVLNSIAYSVGAWIGLRFSASRGSLKT
jgi:hypothetical protein